MKQEMNENRRNRPLTGLLEPINLETPLKNQKQIDGQFIPPIPFLDRTKTPKNSINQQQIVDELQNPIIQMQEQKSLKILKKYGKCFEKNEKNKQIEMVIQEGLQEQRIFQEQIYNDKIKQLEIDHKRQCQKLESQQIELSSNNKKLSFKTNQLEDKLKTIKQESLEWEKKYSQQKTEYQSTQQQLEIKISQLYEKEKETNLKLKDLQQINEGLSFKKQQYENELEQFKIKYNQQKKDYKQKQKQLKIKIKQQNEKEQEMNSELKDLKQKNQDLLVQKQQTFDQLELIQKESNQWKQKFNQLNTENQQIQKQFEIKTNKQNEKEKQLNSELIDLQQKYKNIFDQKQQYEDQLEQQKKKYNEQLAENQSIQKKLDIKTIELNQKEKEINSLQKEKEESKLFQKKIELKNLNSLQQIQECLRIYNPSTNIDNSLVEFAKNYTKILQNPLKETEKISLKSESDKITNELIKQANLKSLSQSSIGILLMQQLLEMHGIIAYITKLSMKELQQQNKENIIQQEILGKGQIEENIYYSINISQKSTQYQNLERAIQCQQNMTEFSSSIKKTIGDLLDNKPLDNKSLDNNIILLRVQVQPTPQVDFRFKGLQIKNENIKKKIVSFNDMGLSLSVQNLLKYAKLTEDMFEPQFNMFWDDSYKGRTEVRGSLQFYNNNSQYTPQLYHFPVGYYGLALKVLEKHGEDKRWLQSNGDPSTWICLFHGTNESCIEQIMKSNLKAGPRNLYGGETCRITNEKITAGQYVNVYLTDQVTEAQRYSLPKSKFDGKVNPKGVKSPVGKPIYYTVENPVADIRPYRILYSEKV